MISLRIPVLALLLLGEVTLAPVAVWVLYHLVVLLTSGKSLVGRIIVTSIGHKPLDCKLEHRAAVPSGRECRSTQGSLTSQAFQIRGRSGNTMLAVWRLPEFGGPWSMITGSRYFIFTV